MTQWTTTNIADLQGRVALVTGANSGLGLEITQALAAKGTHVIMACRNLEKGREAQAEIKKRVPSAALELIQVDLASLKSVRDAVTHVQDTHKHLDLLFNNAGIMAIPRRETQDGFEWQFGVNYLSHFALTGLLLPTLLATPQSRVISMTSMMRMMGKVNFDDLNGKRSYGRWSAYGQSKKADELFAFELQSRLAASKAATISIAAHPGLSNTNLQTTSVTENGSLAERFLYTVLMPLSQSQQMGALPALYAGTSPDIHGGELVGPAGFMRLSGYPVIDTKAQKEYDRPVAERLWNISVELTGVDYASLKSHLQNEIEKPLH